MNAPRVRASTTQLVSTTSMRTRVIARPASTELTVKQVLVDHCTSAAGLML